MGPASDPPRRPKVMRVSTRCRTIDELVAAFATLVDEHSLVVLTDQQREIGSRQPFVVELADGTFVMKGEAEVVESTAPPRGRLRLRFLTLDGAGREVHERMLERKRTAAGAPPPPKRAATEPGGMKPLVRIPEPPSARPAAAPPAPERAAPPAPFARAVPAIPSPKAAPAVSPPTRKTPLPPLPRMATPAVPTPTVRGAAVPAVPQLPAPAPQPAGIAVAAAVPEAATIPNFYDLPDIEADTKVDNSVMEAGLAARSSAAPPVKLAELGERTPGSPYILPANPFGEVAPESLEAFVECMIYEETGQFLLGENGPVNVLGTAEPSIDLLSTPLPDEPVPEPVLVAPPPPPPPVAPPPPAVVAPPPPPPAPVFIPPRHPVPVFVPPPPSLPYLEDDLPPPRRLPWRWIVASVLVVIGIIVLILVAKKTGDGARADSRPAGKASIDAAAKAARTPDAGVPVDAAAVAAPDASAAVEAVAPDAGAGASASDVVVPEGECRIVVIVTGPDEDAKVHLDGKELGEAPVEAAVPCGTQKLKVTRIRYVTEERTVNLVAGTALRVEVKMSRPEVKLTVTSKPTGATISVNGRSLGKAPVTTTVKGFTKTRISAELKGFQPWSSAPYVKKSSNRVNATLKKLPRSRTR